MKLLKLGTVFLALGLTACAALPKGSTKVRWYGGDQYNGKLTANGEIFSDRYLRFASKSLPFGTKVAVTYNGKTAVVICNDRGPNHIELTKFAFEFLADPSVGVIEAQYEILK